MAGNKIPRIIRLNEKQDKALQSLSKKTRVPMSVFIRDGVDMVLTKHLSSYEKQHVEKCSKQKSPKRLQAN